MELVSNCEKKMRHQPKQGAPKKIDDVREIGEEDLESERREIYDSMFPEQKRMRTQKRTKTPVTMNTPTKQQENTVTTSMAKMLLTTIVNIKDFILSLDKYRISRVQYIPSDDSNLLDATLVRVAPLPQQFKFKKSVIPITRAEEITPEQKETFKNIIQ